MPVFPSPAVAVRARLGFLLSLCVALAVPLGCAEQGADSGTAGPDRSGRGGTTDTGRGGRPPVTDTDASSGAPDSVDPGTNDAGNTGGDATTAPDSELPAPDTSGGGSDSGTSDPDVTPPQACEPGTSRPCATACGEGVEPCVGGLWGSCSARQPAPAEICGDGIDNDCNGAIDEGCSPSGTECAPEETVACFDGIPAFENVGACTRGTRRCVDGRFGTCTGSGFPSPEICDGIDNNCNGTIDEGVTRPCANDCGSGNEVCTLGTWGACDAPTPGGEEICGDGIDNNCNGAIDEGCPDPCARAFTRVGLYRTDADSYNAIRQVAIDAGLTVTQSSLIRRDDFERFDYIVTRVNLFEAGDTTEAVFAQDLRRWVENGGRLVVWGASTLSGCSMSAPYTATLPVRFDCSRTHTGGISLLSHPVHAGLSASNAPFTDGYGVTTVAGSGAEVTARGSSGGTEWNAGAAVTLGCGKVFFWGSGAVGAASGFPASTEFWRRAFVWLQAR